MQAGRGHESEIFLLCRDSICTHAYVSIIASSLRDDCIEIHCVIQSTQERFGDRNSVFFSIYKFRWWVTLHFIFIPSEKWIKLWSWGSL